MENKSDARITTLYRGTSEVQRSVIARDVLQPYCYAGRRIRMRGDVALKGSGPTAGLHIPGQLAKKSLELTTELGRAAIAYPVRRFAGLIST